MSDSTEGILMKYARFAVLVLITVLTVLIILSPGIRKFDTFINSISTPIR
jgi:hypothetical protein